MQANQLSLRRGAVHGVPAASAWRTYSSSVLHSGLQAGGCQPARQRSRSIAWSSKRTDVQEALGQLKTALKQQTVGADPAYVNGAAYLKTIGITNQAEIARVLDIAMNPDSLFLSYGDGRRTKNASARKLEVDTDMKPVVDFLLEQRVSVGDIARIITGHPPVLSYSVEERLKPFFAYLAGVGIEDVGAVVVSRPSLLGLDVEANLRKMVDYLLYIETPPMTIVEYLSKSL